MNYLTTLLDLCVDDKTAQTATKHEKGHTASQKRVSQNRVSTVLARELINSDTRIKSRTGKICNSCVQHRFSKRHARKAHSRIDAELHVIQRGTFWPSVRRGSLSPINGGAQHSSPGVQTLSPPLPAVVSNSPASFSVLCRPHKQRPSLGLVGHLLSASPFIYR